MKTLSEKLKDGERGTSARSSCGAARSCGRRARASRCACRPTRRWTSLTIPTTAYVLPTGNLSAVTFEQFREAAKKGGCQVRIFTVEASGVEAVKWELMNYGATRLT